MTGAYDGSTWHLYAGVSSSFGGIYELNTSTASATLLGNPYYSDFTYVHPDDIAFDGSSMWFLDFSTSTHATLSYGAVSTSQVTTTAQSVTHYPGFTWGYVPW